MHHNGTCWLRKDKFAKINQSWWQWNWSELKLAGKYQSARLRKLLTPIGQLVNDKAGVKKNGRKQGANPRQNLEETQSTAEPLFQPLSGKAEEEKISVTS